MYKKIISTSVVVAIAIMLGVVVSSQDNQVVKTDTSKNSLKPRNMYLSRAILSRK